METKNMKSEEEIRKELKFYKKQEDELEEQFENGEISIDIMNKLVDKNIYWQQALEWVLGD